MQKVVFSAATSVKKMLMEVWGSDVSGSGGLGVWGSGGPYGFVSQGVPVGSEQSGLHPQEGPRHATSCCRGLLLQLALQRGHLVGNMEQAECGRERERERQVEKGETGRGKKLNYHL